MSADAIEVSGLVIAEHRGDVFTVDTVFPGGMTKRVLARRSGKLNRNWIRVLPGDRVTVEVSPYDLGRGRIIDRERSAYGGEARGR